MTRRSLRAGASSALADTLVSLVGVRRGASCVFRIPWRRTRFRLAPSRVPPSTAPWSGCSAAPRAPSVSTLSSCGYCSEWPLGGCAACTTHSGVSSAGGAAAERALTAIPSKVKPASASRAARPGCRYPGGTREGARDAGGRRNGIRKAAARAGTDADEAHERTRECRGGAGPARAASYSAQSVIRVRRAASNKARVV